MRIFLFGTGRFFRKRQDFFSRISQNDDFLGFLDNRATEIIQCDGFPVYKPEIVLSMDFDAIVLMSASFPEMKEQLLSLGVSARKIFSWEQYLKTSPCEQFKRCIQSKENYGKKKILLFATTFEYNGGSLACVYAAMCLQAGGSAVSIVVPDWNPAFYDEVLAVGGKVILMPSLPEIDREAMFWIRQFDVVLVNVFQMIQCACEISQRTPILWWIHEPSDNYSSIYGDTRCRFAAYDDVRKMERIRIYAVSEIAKRNFETYYPARVDGILTYGIPDKSFHLAIHKEKSEKIIFAIIGTFVSLKAQDVFLSAVLQLPEETRTKAEFWMIGHYDNDEYGQQIKYQAELVPTVKMTGELTRAQMQQVWPKIDVVVCPSLEETMSIVITEGLMYEKFCIVSDHSGIAQYIIDGENGFICAAGDANSLAEKMKWIFENWNKLAAIRKNGRKTYEENFSMSSFGERLNKALLETEEEYHKRWPGKRA